MRKLQSLLSGQCESMTHRQCTSQDRRNVRDVNIGRFQARCTAVLLSAIFAVGVTDVAAQQSYPAKPIRLVVAAPAGGGADAVARLLAEKLTGYLGMAVTVDNRGGGSGIIGADLVAKSPADGYTVLYDSTAFSVNPSLRKLPYDSLKDLSPVALVVVNPVMLVVSASSTLNSLADLVTRARSSPGKMSFASAGPGTVQHLTAERFKSEAKIDLVHVPYKGASQVLPDLLGGRVDMYFSNMASGLPQIKGGKLRGLVVASEKRSPSAPDIPTMGEVGYPGVISHEWNGVFVPAGTPQEIISRLNTEFNKALADSAVKERLFAIGAQGAGGSPEQFAQFIRSEMAKWDRVVTENKITAE